MTEITKPIFGIDEANLLHKAGWRQCQIFSPTAEIPYDDTSAFFVVCTQCCSVVSTDLLRDPFIEIAVGRRLTKFNPKDQKARGKDVRKFHIPVTSPDFEGLEIDINSRSFIKRELLLSTTPAGFVVKDQDRRNFAGWIARYYSRIALPTALVARLKSSILKDLKQFLDGKREGADVPRHAEIASIWIKFEPDEELSSTDKYEVKLLLICDDPEAAESFDRELIALFGEHPRILDGIVFSVDVNSADETRLSDINGWIRYSEWDHLSDMGEVAAIPTSM